MQEITKMFLDKIITADDFKTQYFSLNIILHDISYIFKSCRALNVYLKLDHDCMLCSKAEHQACMYTEASIQCFLSGLEKCDVSKLVQRKEMTRVNITICNIYIYIKLLWDILFMVLDDENIYRLALFVFS